MPDTICCCSVITSCLTLCDPLNSSNPWFPILHYLPEFAQTDLHWVSVAIQPPHLLCPLLLPSIFPSIRVFSNESVLRIRWPKYQSFSFSISPSNEYSGLISLRIDWLDLLAVQGTLKSLLQHHSLEASALQGSDSFMAQLTPSLRAVGHQRPQGTFRPTCRLPDIWSWSRMRTPLGLLELQFPCLSMETRTTQCLLPGPWGG